MDELNKKYAGCFAKLSSEVVQIVEFYRRNDTISVFAINTTGNTTEYNLDMIDLKLSPIEPGLYNYRNTVLMVKKTGERQWKRGLCKSAYHVENPLSKFYLRCEGRVDMSNRPSVFKWDVSSVAKLFKSFDSYRMAVKSLTSGKALARAFDKGWIVSFSMDSDGFWLSYNKAKVASIIDGKIYVTSKSFLEEIKDLNRRQCIGEIVC
jgi:uncharacterized protein YkuJ